MEVIRIPTKFKFSTLAAKVRFLNLDIHVAVAPRIGHCSAHGSAHVPVLFLNYRVHPHGPWGTPTFKIGFKIMRI